MVEDTMMNFCQNPYQKEVLYIAPFYEDCTDYIENSLIYKIRNAKKRVYICSQHLSAYKYTISKAFKYGVESTEFIQKSGLLESVIDQFRSGLDVRLLSQTYDDGKGTSYRKPQNSTNFKWFVQDLERAGFREYGVNANVHGKFYVIDDQVITSSCNCTPTQFIYNKYVDIPEFGSADESYTGIHCEVGQYLVLDNPDTVQQYIGIFELWSGLDETVYPLKK